MTKVLVIAKDSDSRTELRFSLTHPSLTSTFTSYGSDLQHDMAAPDLQVILPEVSEKLPDPAMWQLILKAKQERKLPIIALVRRENMGNIVIDPEIDDFLVTPYNSEELALRIGRLIRSAAPESAEPISSHGLVIDPDTCEVSVDGRKVDLTFKEYELIKLLASNKGHVFTREALLDKIWGYDYYGGDRTVDVHVRRLRSKIEQDHPYIETVRNIGYRFIKEI